MTIWDSGMRMLEGYLPDYPSNPAIVLRAAKLRKIGE